MKHEATFGQQDQAAPLPLGIYFGWGLGTLGITAYMVGSYLLLRFMTDYMAVPAEVAGTIFALAKIYDAVADPLIGSWSDRFNSRWGRRRPFLMAGAFGCGLIFMLAFNMPVVPTEGAAITMLAGLLLLHATSYAIFAVPYMTMPAEMTDNAHERSKLMSFRVVNGSLGNMLGGFATASLIAYFGGGLAGHRAMGVIMGIVIFAILMGCFFMTSRARLRPVDARKHIPYRQQLKLASRNRPFVILQIAKLMLLSAAALHTASAPFFVQRSLGMSDEWLGTIYLTLTIGTVIAQPGWLWLARRVGKRTAYTFGGVFTACVWIMWFPLGHGTPEWMVIAIGLLAGLGNGGIVMISQSMLPDTMQFQYLRTGNRIEGSFAGLYIMVEKLGQAIGASLTGIILGLFGYIEAKGGITVAQPQSAVLGIALCYSIFSTAFLVLSIVAMRFYPLDERTMTLRGEPTAGD
ncbi:MULTISPECIES: MFS transporter [unclassified Novosphingobium]|uniref:MFS transporter n=1 Tax=unclassified Novosphingobium TaxID=2644732 RepID=UPI00020EED55|nr:MULTISPECIES: MFS transporter [unclassified Novosphingobium]GFM29834.1 sugar (glycoside-pentoside-hexuronide) transporter [Novosphingobium sp. PY1]CCA92877.1 sugar (glycoside-pentoside-hexuronide) transporter [Novosphingobium sp. PP1Y]